MWRRTIGYEIQELLGEGSQGKVFKALRRDPSTNLTQILAVKILHSEIAVDLWKREFESLSKVRSPYCVQVHAFERLNRRPALVLEYVDGVSLSALTKTCWLEEDEVQEILAQLESAILDLYKYGVFHGDLSPHNVLIDRDGHLRLLDFGLANCGGGEIRFTPEFAAPERLCGAKADLASDIFSLGRVEQTMRGQPPLMDPDSPYLKGEPSKRSLRGLFSRVERREKLAGRVRAFQERRKNAADARTRTLIRKNRTHPKALILAVITSCLLIMVPGAGQSSMPTQLSVLQIRTHHWHYFHLNGSPLGYAPVNVPLEAGKPHRLTWVSAKTRGERVIQAGRGSTLQLRDRDFSH